MTSVNVCPLCANNGRISRIRPYKINFEEVVLLCDFSRCSYPFGITNFRIIKQENNIPSLNDGHIVSKKIQVQDDERLKEVSISIPLIEDKVCKSDISLKEEISPSDFSQTNNFKLEELIKYDITDGIKCTEEVKINNSKNICDNVDVNNIENALNDEKKMDNIMDYIKTVKPKVPPQVFVIKDPKMIKNLKLLSSLTKLRDAKKGRETSNLIKIPVPAIVHMPNMANKTSRFPKFTFEDKKTTLSENMSQIESSCSNLSITNSLIDGNVHKDEPSVNNEIIEEENKYNPLDGNTDLCDINFSDDLLWSANNEGSFDLNNDITDEFLQSLLS